MNTHADKTQENRSQSVANAVSQKQNGADATFQFVDNRPEATAQQKLQEITNNSPQVAQLKSIQGMAHRKNIHQETIETPSKVCQLFRINGLENDESPLEAESLTPAELEAAYFRTMRLSEIGEHALSQLPDKTLNLVQVYGSNKTLFNSANNAIQINIDNLSQKSPQEQCAVLCHETFHFFDKMHINLDNTKEAEVERRQGFRLRTQTGSEQFGSIEEELVITGKITAEEHQGFLHQGLDHDLFNENAVLRDLGLPERTSHESSEQEERKVEDPTEVEELISEPSRTEEQEAKRLAFIAMMERKRKNRQKK